MTAAWLRLGVPVALALLLGACGGAAGDGGGGGGGGIGGTGATSSGLLRVSLTDAPACGYDAVHVTVDRLRIHADAAASDGAAGWSEIALDPPRRVDLLSLANGVLDELGRTELPAGRYRQLRLVLAANDAQRPLANAVTPTGAPEVALDTPGATPSGLKLDADFEVVPGRTVDVVLDFDACRSVVPRGHSGRYNLKPVIRVDAWASDAASRIEGRIDTAALGADTQVSVQQRGTVVKATRPDADGRYVLYPLARGSYDLVVAAPGRATAVVSGIAVDAGGTLEIGSAAQPLATTASAARVIGGSVAPASATVRVLQTLSDGTPIEVAWPAVDAQTGAFAASLPTAAPRRAAWQAGVAPALVADSASTARYSVQAAASGVLQSVEVDLSAATLPPLSLSLP